MSKFTYEDGSMAAVGDIIATGNIWTSDAVAAINGSVVIAIDHTGTPVIIPDYRETESAGFIYCHDYLWRLQYSKLRFRKVGSIPVDLPREWKGGEPINPGDVARGPDGTVVEADQEGSRFVRARIYYPDGDFHGKDILIIRPSEFTLASTFQDRNDTF